MKFKDMPYERISVESIKEEMKTLIQKLKEAKDFEEAEALFLENEKLQGHVFTMCNLALVRHSINTEDKFYDEEQNYWNNAYPQIQEFNQEWTKALLDSPFKDNFAKKYGNIMFLNAEIDLKTFSPEIIPMMQEENELTTAYEKLLAGAQIPFEGKIYTISQMSPFKNDKDDARRLAAWKAEGQWYKDNQGELDRLYDKLVHLRDQMGKKLGYTDFTELGYYRMRRNCYDKQDVQKFREAVQKYVVPVAAKIYERQAERLGKSYPLSYADAAIEFCSGNPKPKGNPDEIVASGKKFYDWLSPETSEFFNHMIDDELMDLLSTKGKQGGGYCTSFQDYKTPFIFANFNGTQHDIEVITHEAGHAFAAYLNRNRVPYECIWPSLEACEVHSMSMEFFTEPWMDLFFGDRAKDYLSMHFEEFLMFIPYGTMVDEFQNIVYKNPKMTPKERKLLWRTLEQEYKPHLDYADNAFMEEGGFWQKQHHIYDLPYYYIDYCIAGINALQYKAWMDKDFQGAWKSYMEFSKYSASLLFTELEEKVGLMNPFKEGTIKKIVEDLEKNL
mgnify:CR=1 FL=1